ncbi:YidC/Oxa1 family membrane protein insertase [Streptomyces filamentosus]|uniref:YidC/Oxa1 family membrane protein insertase n=1 Tax=Streptomyces filamentosus TaxID=67294 RepID=UPI003815EECC
MSLPLLLSASPAVSPPVSPSAPLAFSPFPSSVLDAFSAFVGELAGALEPLFAGGATAAAVVLLTALVRLAVHPLSRAAVRGQEARARLAPRVAALRERYGNRPERFQRALLDLHAEEKVSPLAGLLPGLLQVPAFLLLYSLFSSGDRMAGHGLLGAPLDGRWAGALADGGPFGAAGLVYAALFALTAAVAAYQYRQTRRQLAGQRQTPGAKTPGAKTPGAKTPGAKTPGANAPKVNASKTNASKTKPPKADVPKVKAAGVQPPLPGARFTASVLPLLSFGTVVTVAFVPLAVGLYLATSTTWAVVERTLLTRKGPLAERGLAG